MSALWLAVVLAAVPSRSVDGGLSLELIQDVIEWHAPEVNACFSNATGRPSVRYRFEVTPEGKVTRLAFLDAQRAESPRITCVGTALEKWRFPAAGGGTAIEWNFSASAVDAGIPTEPEFLAPEQLPIAWVDGVSRCYDASSPNENREGRLTLEFVVTRAGAVVEVTTRSVNPSLSATGFPGCLATDAKSWSSTASRATRRLVSHWILASSERRAKGFFDPTESAREVIAHQPRVTHLGGGLEKSVIKWEIDRASGQIRDCYEFGLRDDPELGGLVSVAFTIGPDGHVIQSHMKEDLLHHERTTTCILGVVNRLEFPPPEGGGSVDVTFPWILKSSGE